MKTADFAAHLTEFLSHYLPELKNISTNTISSYCDAFRLFLGYCQDVEGMRIEKLSIDDLTPELVDHFLQWLRIERNNGTATRSQRLAAIRSFVKYLQIKEPRLLLNFQQILAIPVKRAERKAINPLTKEAIALILRQPDTSTLSGRRDATILCFLYDTAARVQEICDLRIEDVRLDYPASVKIQTEGAEVKHFDDMEAMKDEIDVMILCGGSATDLPVIGPKVAASFNTIDSFDTHAKIPEYFANVDKAAKEGKNVSIISVGWDPGMFSLNRLYANAILTNGKDYTFWGKGVSQGHSDAVRRIKGVKDAKQYTIPVEAALEAVRNGENPDLTTRQKHTRECFVVAEEGADLAQIENDIKTMPNYFSDYDTTVHFISEEELKRDHSGIPHGGFVIRSGKTGWNDENNHVIEYSLKLDSNPEFTSSVLVAYARAAYRMNKEGQSGAKTVFDVAPAYLCAADGAELRKHLL